MTDIIVAPDVEAFLVGYLGDALGVPVTTRVPEDRPPRFVRLERLGGTRRDIIRDSALVVFEAWAETFPDAFDLANPARGHVYALPYLDVALNVYRVTEAGGLARSTDPRSGSPRYIFSTLIDSRGVPLS